MVNALDFRVFPEIEGVSPRQNECFSKIGVGCSALGFSGTCGAVLPKTEWPPFEPVKSWVSD